MKWIIAAIFASVLYPRIACAQLVAWQFGPDTRGDEEIAMSTFEDPYMFGSELTRGVGVQRQKATYSFAGIWPECKSLVEAVRKKTFYQFSLKTRKNYRMSLDRIELILRIQPNGPQEYVFAYSVDGDNYVNVGHPVRVSPTSNDGEIQEPIDLSTISDLQNIPSKTRIYFRLYAWGSKDGWENTAFRIGKSTSNRPALAVYGSVEN